MAEAEWLLSDRLKDRKVESYLVMQGQYGMESRTIVSEI